MNLKIQRLLNKMSTISGRRKEATAVVRLTKGKGNLTVNKKNIDEYFGRDVAKMIIRQPFTPK